MVGTTLRSVLWADFDAMAEGETLTTARIAARVAVHARWRAVLVWRVAQHLFGSRSGKPLSLWLTDRVLSSVVRSCSRRALSDRAWCSSTPPAWSSAETWSQASV